MKCICMMFELVGFPCPHMIVIIKIEHLEEIPESCIMKRWSKLAKDRSKFIMTMKVKSIRLTSYDMVHSALCAHGCLILHLNRKKLLKRLDVKYKDSLVKWKNFAKI